MRNLRYILAAALAAQSAGWTPPVRAAEPTSELEAIRAQIRLLEAKLTALEKRADESARAVPNQPRVVVEDGRVELAAADGATSLRLRALIQGDARWYRQGAAATHDSFILRRARLIFEGRFGRDVTYQLVPEFGGSSPTLQDANVSVALTRDFRLRAGKFKVPVGLEQLQSDAAAFFAERSIASALTPNRDVGLQVEGTGWGGKLDYALGLFNGQPDGGSSNNGADFDDGKTVALRLFGRPFGGTAKGLGLGAAISAGRYATAAGRTSGYRTDGQQSVFSYRSATVADGDGLVISPQASFYAGPFGLLAEYVASSIELTNGAAPARTIRNTAWNLSLGYVLTGEAASYRGVVPAARFDPSVGNWGAVEVVARAAGLDVDDEVFTGGAGALADPATGATQVTSYGVGLNWYLSKSVRTSVDVFHSRFDSTPGTTPAAGSVLAEGETVCISRLQLSF